MTVLIVESSILPALAQPREAVSVASTAATPGPEAATYQISAGDVVSINVFPVDEYSREVTVQPDGKIELPLIGGLLVKGLTAKELQALLESKFARFVAGPKVTVNVRHFSGRRVAIIGEVRGAGYYEYRDGMKLLELLSMAGGLSDFAKASKTRILRTGGAVPESIGVNLAQVLDGRLERNPPMAPGDIVVVPKGRITQNVIWINTNILPWISMMTLVSSVILLVHSNTGKSQ